VVTELSGLDRLNPRCWNRPPLLTPTSGARSSPDLVGEPLSRAQIMTRSAGCSGPSHAHTTTAAWLRRPHWLGTHLQSGSRHHGGWPSWYCRAARASRAHSPSGHQGLRVAVFFNFVPSLFLVLYELSLILCNRKFKILRYCHPHVVSIRNVMALTQSWIKRSMSTAEMEKKTKVTSSFFFVKFNWKQRCLMLYFLL
jgi:hypothetical protein